MHLKIYLRKKSWKSCKRGGFTYISPDHFRITCTSKMISKLHPKKKHDHQKTWSLMLKRSQNGAEIYAKPNKKTMPKFATKKIKTIINKSCFSKSKIIEIHCKNNYFWWLKRLHTRKEKIQNNIKNETTIHPQIDEKSIQISCSKKRYPKHQKTINKLSKERVKHEEKLETNHAPKR